MEGSLLGYFTLTHKIIKIPKSGLSNTRKKFIERFAQFDDELNAYPVSAFLIAQFGKNYALEEEKRISGNLLMQLVDQELNEIQHQIGGGLKFLDCDPDAKLIDFYHNQQHFILFGKRVSENDGKEYLQFIKFF